MFALRFFIGTPKPATFKRCEDSSGPPETVKACAAQSASQHWLLSSGSQVGGKPNEFWRVRPVKTTGLCSTQPPEAGTLIFGTETGTRR